MTWTDQKVQMLKEMWGRGYSAKQIAGLIGGLTRNAVIGKAHRLGLSVEAGARRAGAPASSTATGGMGSAIKTSSSRKRTMLRPLPVMPTPSTIKSFAKGGMGNLGATGGMGEIVRPSARDSVFAIKRTEGVAMTKVGERHCRWPVGDPRSPDFRFCGCPAHEGLPYCTDHARVAYQNVSRRTRATANPEVTETGVSA
jgi:GcrA cell cycle regulator